MNPYEKFVLETVALLQSARQSPSVMVSEPSPQSIAEDAPTVLIFSPHPDDECIIGGLPLRLLRESRMRVVNIAVTQGSLLQRRSERYQELSAACRYLGFELVQIGESGLEKINLETRDHTPGVWYSAIAQIDAILRQYRPSILVCPHAQDGNSTHIGTHYLIFDALNSLDYDFSCFVVETEYWQPMQSPNLMVESSPQDVADLVAALSLHVGEIQRNPYHVRLPAWMIDNVRRGGELVGKQGDPAPDFHFATLYRLSHWHDGGLKPVSVNRSFLSISDNMSEVFVKDRG